MTKIALFSDIHLEFQGKKQWSPKFNGEEYMILAGDIQVGLKENSWFVDLLEHRDVIYIIGNHEGYHNDLLDVINGLPLWTIRVNEEAEARGFKHKLISLNNQTFEIDDIKFIASTLWTDFNKNDNLVKLTAQRNLNDYNYTTYAGGRLKPNDIYNEHVRSLAFVEQELDKPTNKKKVLITHHALSYQSIHQKFRNPRDDMFNYLYYSDLENILEKADYAFHGHSHCSFKYSVGNCQIITNPYGYKGYELNPDFKDDLIIEI